MSRLFVNGLGAVSPAGWSVEALRNSIQNAKVPANSCVQRPGWPQPLACWRVPPPNPVPAAFSHARLRRTTPITSFAASATLQAIADAKADPKTERIGMILCVLAGCVQFTKRFYHEAWKDPSTASPLVFAETVFNAPSSHIAAILPSAAINYTLLGDSSAFLEGIALAAGWLEDGVVDGCIVVGAEEIDWPTLDAFKLFSARVPCSEGAGAIYVSLRPSDSAVEVVSITDPYVYCDKLGRAHATKCVRADLSAPSRKTLLCDARAGSDRYDAADTAAWRDWSGLRISPKTILGEAMMASGAWQCVAAIDAVRQKVADSALVSISGCLQQAVGACFARNK